MEIPTIAEEIERKAVTELQRVMFALTTHRMGIVQAAASLQTLWEVSSGLVSAETMTLVGQSATAVQKQLSVRERPDEVAVFVASNQVAVVKRLVDRVNVQIQPAEVGALGHAKDLMPPVDHPNSMGWGKLKFKATVEALGKTMARVL